MDWFRLEANYEKFNSFPRAEAVQRAQEQWWMHTKGDEHLAANPCFVPGLQEILRTHTSSFAHNEDKCRDVSDVEFRPPPSSKAKDAFGKLPYELRTQILYGLESSDITNLRLASPAFRSLPQSVFRTLLLRKKPWIWEVWCTLPYSLWAMTTSTSLKRQDERWWKEKKAFDDSIEALLEEFGDPSDSQNQEIQSLCRKYEEAVERRDAWKKDMSVPVLPSTETNWCEIFIQSEKQRNTNLGFMNRERIWRDCEEIINRIEKYRREGAIRPVFEQKVLPCDGSQ
ncbi:hypothetical protein ColLi_10467 [Colletotrichum liriopes]|uniref:F-box domain-containing protein n=1 Tax=Colletotrichum liriopes TaxID=708192 RepID=A0AA37GUQ9_9PEZI|nr:hypothetical protein ColLi_10467 [Colletotrichum liriopes]